MFRIGLEIINNSARQKMGLKHMCEL